MFALSNYKTIKNMSDFRPRLHGQKKVNFEFFNQKESRVLVIGDLHAPFDLDSYFDHCVQTYERYNCNRVVFIGDVIDNHYSSYHETDANGMGGSQELELAIKRLERWYHRFPDADVTIGNHDRIIMRKAQSSAVPKQWIKDYKEVLNKNPGDAYKDLSGLARDLIPEEHAKHITLSYDTNLTELRYKNKSIFNYVNKFQNIQLGVSCDHYGKKLDWMRYPIDREKFEHNLLEAKGLVKQLNCSTSMLNIFELKEMYNYYMDNFNIPMTFVNTVRGPLMLSIRNLKQKDKKAAIEEREKTFEDDSITDADERTKTFGQYWYCSSSTT